MISAASDPRWCSDPSPSYTEIAAVIGCDLPNPTSPSEPASDIETCVQLFWPGLPPWLQSLF